MRVLVLYLLFAPMAFGAGYDNSLSLASRFFGCVRHLLYDAVVRC